MNVLTMAKRQQSESIVYDPQVFDEAPLTKLFTITFLAPRYDIQPKTLRQMCLDGQIGYMTVGKKGIRIRKSDALDYEKKSYRPPVR